jgi:hypothetical protein
MMGKHIAVQRVWYPNQRVIPTVVAIVGILAAQWPAEWLVGTLAASVAIQGVLAKIMAVPGVNEWLTGLGAGSVPRSVVEGE